MINQKYYINSFKISEIFPDYWIIIFIKNEQFYTILKFNLKLFESECVSMGEKLLKYQFARELLCSRIISQIVTTKRVHTYFRSVKIITDVFFLCESFKHYLKSKVKSKCKSKCISTCSKKMFLEFPLLIALSMFLFENL